MVEVDRHQRLVAVSQHASEFALAGCANGSIYFVDGRVTTRRECQINDRHVDCGDAHRKPVESTVEFR